MFEIGGLPSSGQYSVTVSRIDAGHLGSVVSRSVAGGPEVKVGFGLPGEGVALIQVQLTSCK